MSLCRVSTQSAVAAGADAKHQSRTRHARGASGRYLVVLRGIVATWRCVARRINVVGQWGMQRIPYERRRWPPPRGLVLRIRHKMVDGSVSQPIRDHITLAVPSVVSYETATSTMSIGPVWEILKSGRRDNAAYFAINTFTQRLGKAEDVRRAVVIHIGLGLFSGAAENLLPSVYVFILLFVNVLTWPRLFIFIVYCVGYHAVFYVVLFTGQL